MKFLAIVAALAVASTFGCKTTGSNLNDSNISYLDTAKLNFDAGQKALKDGLYDEAISFFDHVRSKFPYSQYAALSDLAMGDTYFAAKKWLEAADAYEFFIRFHPRNDAIATARYFIARSYYEAIPSDFFLFPPSYVKDQSATQSALKAANLFLESFPKDLRVPEVKKIKEKLSQQLAKRDMEVAQFYAARKKWRGAIERYERVVSLYPDAGIADQALFKSAQIAKKYLGEDVKAQSLAEKLVANYPKSAYVSEAQKMIPGEEHGEVD